MTALGFIILLVTIFVACCLGPIIYYIVPMFFSVICWMFGSNKPVHLTAAEAKELAAKNKIVEDKLEAIKEAKRAQKMTIFIKECIERMHIKIQEQVKRGNTGTTFSTSEVEGDGYINDDTAKLLCNHFEQLGYKATLDNTSYSNRWFAIRWEK